MLRVEATGPLTIPVDLGRFGHARWGVAASGPFDHSAHNAANAAVGNAIGAATLEILTGGLTLRSTRAVLMCLTGAIAPARVDGLVLAHARPFFVPAGGRIEITTATSGLRSYLAVAGGFDLPPVLGSRCYDTLSGLGPPPLQAGDLLAVGRDVSHRSERERSESSPRAPAAVAGPLELALLPPPRPVPAETLAALAGASWRVSDRSDRVAVRLTGPVIAPLPEVPSEGVVTGAVQLPPGGQPLIFGPDHPLTGGYPVLGVVRRDGVNALAQRHPGSTVTFVKRDR